MYSLLNIIVLAPLVGFLILSVAGRYMKRPAAAIIGVGSVGISALLTIILGIDYLSGSHEAVTVHLWKWIDIDGFSPDIAFYLDPLSLVFVFIVTFVGFLIHLYSVEYMHDDGGFPRFFAYMNLFVTSMLILVLADNYLFLYLGWEGVGLCSFLLIGFWYNSKENSYAARKAFFVTRVGDTALAVGLFLLFLHFRSLNIQDTMAGVEHAWPAGSSLANIAALLILGGAVGKSAQLPLQTWLPDAMAGPTPVSALIHAATMVTAGVYIIARSHAVFALSPIALNITAIVGALTLLIAGLSALTQYDIKKVLAYSTISQIGYMFLALGVGAWSAGVFHFFTHAFFKALLFLGSGVVILAMHHEQDMFKMGGLRKKMPWTFYTFLAGAAALSALPLISSGFYSKDQILYYALEGEGGNIALLLAGMAGAFITAIYTFRMVFITFYGEQKTEVGHLPAKATMAVLVVLATAALLSGFLNTPENLLHITAFSGFMEGTFHTHEGGHNTSVALILQVVSSLIVLAGIWVAYVMFKRGLYKREIPVGASGKIKHLLFSGFGFDYVYDLLIIRPFEKLAELNRKDIIDMIYTGIAGFFLWMNRKLSLVQSGSLNWYLAGLTLGAIIILTLIITL